MIVYNKLKNMPKNKTEKITIDDLAAMFARNFSKFDKTDKKIDKLSQDVGDIKRILIFGRHEERIANLEVDLKETKKILQFK